MNKKTFRILLALGTISTLTALGNNAYCAPPVIIEMFGQNNYVYDLDLQKRIYEAARINDNVIVLNCRILQMITREMPNNEDEAARMREQLKQASLEQHGVNLYFNEFCTNRTKNYATQNGDILPKPLLVMVNGRWVANNHDILPAIKMGGTDKLAEISLTREEDILHITIPDTLDIKEGEGKLKLFVYAPSTGINHGEQLDTTPWGFTVKDTIKRNLDDYRRLVVTASIPDEIPEEEQVFTEEDLKEIQRLKEQKNKEIQNIYFRPVAAMEDIGTWDGTKTEYAVSLTKILSQFDIKIAAEKLGYVVILQEGEEQTGPIIAAGELIPSEENIHISSPPPAPKDEAPETQKNPPETK
ncbi:MAG: hypothetical protein KAJ40_06750 [Alphaproteobacteria bacterium]|nr:hypothetical protein [Alphaproteobacteria bacterium]